jgi:sugar phosphate isomerase/epimerase
MTHHLFSRSTVIALALAGTSVARATSVGAQVQAKRPGANAAATHRTGDFRAPFGVQLWSFREQAKPDPLAMFRMARRMGITHVETAGLYDMPPASFAAALKSAGLRATSMHASYDDFKKTPDVVIANAKALGAHYVGLAWYPHEGAFTEADARKAIADFNEFGRTLKKAGLTFFYHNHGYEPVPFGDGTLLDLIIQQTDPALVKFEMDVLWTWLPGADPVALIHRYPGRFRLMHIKDMKPGIARGSLSGGLPAEQQAVIGQGQVPWAELLAAAARDGFAYYYLEDETPDPVKNVPPSLAFLSQLKFPAASKAASAKAQPGK